MKNYFLNLILEVLISLLLFFFLATIVSLTDVSESIIIPFTIIISMISVFVASFNFSKAKGKKGILYGGILGINYIFILYLISSIINNNFELNANSLIMICLSVLIGIIAGIIGVNFSNV